jgi:hypothetical protein
MNLIDKYNKRFIVTGLLSVRIIFLILLRNVVNCIYLSIFRNGYGVGFYYI